MSAPSSTLTELNREAHRRAAARYRWDHATELREKAQIRMAAYRQRFKEQPTVDEQVASRTKEADRKYRTKKRDLLAFKQRICYETCLQANTVTN
ncbi:hypothetical protein DFH07DRAFT_967714 [Mycena maculata]|uniref:Uncharacterized protein n=1 Tax=Mycena maculata TaxID=230809 RepID=A0AAD7I4X5_9AGAR|nr:hypothetical protein DFH07DRAFT_967714 [Mycena maculata]